MHRFESPAANFAQEISDGNTWRAAENAIKNVRNSIKLTIGDTAFSHTQKEKKAAYSHEQAAKES